MKASLKNALPIIARYYSENLGMRVEFGASGACHMPGLIGLPNLDDSQESLVMALGYIGHESAHEKFTDGLISDHLPAGFPRFVHSLVNALEDIRIEGLMFKQHPATVSDISVVVRKLLGGNVTDLSGLHDAEVLHNACLIVGRARLLNQPLQEEAIAYMQVLKERFGPGRAVKILALLGKVPSLPNTKAAADLGYAILDVLDEEEPEDETPKNGDPDPQNSQGDSDQNQQPDSGQGQGGGDDGGNAQSPSNGQPGEQPGSSGGGDASTGGGDAGGNDPSQSLKQKVLSAGADVLEGLVSDLGDEIAGRLGKLKTAASNTTPASVADGPMGSELLGAEVVSAGQAASLGLRQVLLGLMQGAQNNRVQTRRQGRSIDAKRLAQVPVGETRIFRHMEAVQSVNAAFEVLLDGSGSMSGDKMLKAEIATVAVLTALETIPNVSSGAMVFPRMEGSKVSVGVLKRHRQPLRSAILENRFGVTARGGTPLAEAIWPAAGDLLYAKGERKVLMIATDGDPNSVEEARSMVERCNASGIEVLAIAFGDGVNTDRLNQVYGKNWKHLDSVDQLRNALFEVVRNVLTNKAAA